MLVWLGDLALISYLGDFPERAKGAGNLGLLDFNLGAAVTFVLSVVVVWLALRQMLPANRVDEVLSDRSATEAGPGLARGDGHRSSPTGTPVPLLTRRGRVFAGPVPRTLTGRVAHGVAAPAR